jgi:hypothetical protein
MPKAQLDRLVAGGTLKLEAPAPREIEGLIRSGAARLHDAEQTSLSVEGRFDLAYNAAHALALAALRWHGYRPDKRYIVFQALAHTLDLPAAQWRVLDDAHRRRNLIEYEGRADVDQALLAAVLRVTREIAERMLALGPPKD